MDNNNKIEALDCSCSIHRPATPTTATPREDRLRRLAGAHVNIAREPEEFAFPNMVLADILALRVEHFEVAYGHAARGALGTRRGVGSPHEPGFA